MARQTRHHKGGRRPEYISGKLLIWAGKRGITIQHIQPGQPQQNVYIDRYNRFRHWARTNAAFNDSLQHEWLDRYIIETIVPYGDCGQSLTGQRKAQDHAKKWLWTYNNGRANIPFTVCRQTVTGQRGIGGITPAKKLKLAA